MFKKAISCSLVLVLVIALFTACGSSTQNNSGTTGTANTTESSKTDTNAPAQKKVTLRFMGWEVSPLETQSVKDGIAKFEAEHPGVTIDYVATTNKQVEYNSKLLTMMAGNAAPDCMFIASSYYNSYIKKGTLMDLTDKFNKEFNENDFIPSSVEIMKRNGKIYGVSSCTVSPILFYNKEIFDKAGEPYPPNDPQKAWTFDEMREVAKRLTKKNGDKVEVYGIYGHEMEEYFNVAVLSAGEQVIDKDITKFMANTPTVIDVVKQIRDARLVDGSAPSASTLQELGMSNAQMLQTGKIAMLISGSWALQELSKMDFEVGMGVLPKFKDAVTVGQAHVHAIWNKTSQPDLAWEFIKFLSSKEYQTANIKDGLWLPNRTSMYTAEGMKDWYTPEVYGENYEPLLKYARAAYPRATALISSGEYDVLQTEILGEIYKNEKDIAQMMGNFETRANEIIKNR